MDDTDHQNLRADITKEDLEFALKAMKTSKSPGADGLTVSFYRKYWLIIGDLVFDSITYAQEIGSFSTHQQLGILKLLPKVHKDPRYIKNLRPITLLNVDYKLFTKVLAD